MAQAPTRQRRPSGIERRLLAQFGGPRGLLGTVAGWIMAGRNLPTNTWMVELLEVAPDDAVLDVGCGPGRGVQVAAARAGRGSVAGVDVSAVMVRQAARRNRAAVASGRVELRLADAARLPFPDGRFTKAGSVNSVQFWTPPERGFAELHRVLAPGGRVAIVLRAHNAQAGRFDRTRFGAPAERVAQLATLLAAAGFHEVRRLRRDCGGEPHWALVARR
jgi:ubiquinone/menaquinone biosynthesis C-methylase UbiE